MGRSRQPRDDGYAMAALLVGLSVMAVMMSVMLPAWNTAARREREAELIFRGEQYARAIRLFQMRYANATPPNVDVLVNERFLRKKYTDPITGGDFQVVPPGGIVAPQAGRGAGGPAGGESSATPRPGGRGAAGTVTAGVGGVVSRSSDTALRLYNGRGKYNEWIFAPVQATAAAGGPAGVAGAPTGRGRGNPGGPAAGSPPGRGRGPVPGFPSPSGRGPARGPQN